MGKRGLADISEEMQFELQVLEVVLDYVTAFMEHLTSDIEAVAYPGLDAIVIKVLARGFGQQPSIRLKSHAQSVTGASQMTELELSVGMGKLAIALALGKAQLQHYQQVLQMCWLKITVLFSRSRREDWTG